MAMRSAASAVGDGVRSRAVDRERDRRRAALGRRRSVDVHAGHAPAALEERGEHLRLRSAERVHAGVEQELGGGVDGGDRLEARRAGLPLAWAVVGRRADLGVGQLVEQRRVGAQHAGVRAVPLVRAAREDVAAEGAHVDRLVRRQVHGVDEHAGAGVVGRRDDRGEVRHRADQVRRAGERDPACALVDAGDHLGRIEQAGRRVERGEDVLGAGLVARQAPRRDVGVVVEAGADDAVAGPQRRRDGRG